MDKVYTLTLNRYIGNTTQYKEAPYDSLYFNNGEKNIKVSNFPHFSMTIDTSGFKKDLYLSSEELGIIIFAIKQHFLKKINPNKPSRKQLT